MSSYTSAVNLVESTKGHGKIQLVDNTMVSNCDPTDLVEMAKQIQKADEFTRANACSKLSVIAEQVRFLQEQARKILEEAHRNDDLHHVACNFKKIPGQVYYLYHRPSGQRYISRLSPQEWGSSCPHQFLGGYKLQHDMSWTEEKDIETKEDEIMMINKIIDTSRTLQATSNLSIQLNYNK